MLEFNPERQLILTPDNQHRLQATLTIHNPSSRPAPFKVKSTQPSLFHVQPSIGLLNPHQKIKITISTKQANSSQLSHDISYHNRFLIEFALIDRHANSTEEALRMIHEGNKQDHKLYLVVSGGSQTYDKEDRSAVSHQYTYRTVHQNQDQRTFLDKDRYKGLNQGQKSQYLTRELDRLERQCSELRMIPSKKGKNFWKFIVILVLAIMLGNWLGHSLGFGGGQDGDVQEKSQEHEDGEGQGFNWFGLAEYWREPKKPKQRAWWQFWS